MSQSRGKILIVDDEEPIRDILSRKLQAEGYSCECASDGREAIWKAFMKDFELVIMDIKMPGLSGIETLPKIVTDHPDTAVVMLTAVADLQIAVEAMKLGAYDYLPKPFNLDDLALRVERALERRRLLMQNKEYQLRLEQKIERQEGQIQKYHAEVSEARLREEAVMAELQSVRQPCQEEIAMNKEETSQGSVKGVTSILSRFFGGKTVDPSSNEDSSEPRQAEKR
ncbi:MAG: response regulator [Chloroflexota bacterium]|nr:response regulator [Chloroflexota bacterium]